MKLLSVNLGKERTLRRKNHVEQTGIFKIPVSRPVKLTNLGLEGDTIVSKKHHGGPDQAVYIYGGDDYAWWSHELGREIGPGTFGDNLTISGLKSTDFNIGDVLRIGEVLLQITAPRIPCGTFARRMEDPQWVKKFRHAERPGLYCRVLQEGMIEAGVGVSTEKYTGETVPILEAYRIYFETRKSEETIRRLLDAPIDIRSRKGLEAELENLIELL